METKKIREYNGRVMDLMSLFLNVGSDLITEEMIEEVSGVAGYSLERSYVELLGAICELDTCGKDREFFQEYFLPMVHEVDMKPFMEDPFYKKVKSVSLSSGEWEMKMMKLQPYEAFVSGDFKVFPNGKMIPSIGFFRKAYEYPAVLENKREWMTLLPNETLTTQPALDRAHGKVLTYGLGLGYFTIRAAAKEKVESVTVVERSKEAYELFSSCIFPLFPEVHAKIKIILQDAFEYAAKISDGDYDFVFADIWHDAGDGPELYHRFQSYESNCPNAEYMYWLENTIKCYENKELWPEVTNLSHNSQRADRKQ